MKRSVLGGLLFLSGIAAAAIGPASADDIKLVEFFIKTPTAQLPPQAIDHFMTIDPESLPKKLRQPYQAKRLELNILKQRAEGKKKGLIRMPEGNCTPPRDAKSGDIQILKLAGFVELREDEVDTISQKSHCTEQDMYCEFSLQILLEKDPRTKRKIRRFLIDPEDPLNIYLAKNAGRQTNFFGMGAGPVCSH